MERVQVRRMELPPDDTTRDRVGIHRELREPMVAKSGEVDVVAELVHDLRSPLTAILVIAERLLRGEFGEVSGDQSRQLGIMYGAALGLHALTSDVMDFAKGGGRGVDVEPGPFSVREVIESVAGMVEPLAIEKGLDLRTSLPDNGIRWGPRSALSRILLNLATNALKFTEEGYVEIGATPSANDCVPFSVRDSGPGIPPETLQSLRLPLDPRRPLFEYPPSERGLGLTMCRRLLQAMRSDLHVQTRPGWGTRFAFEVELPKSGPRAVAAPRGNPT